jgi:hypothetical protein
MRTRIAIGKRHPAAEGQRTRSGYLANGAARPNISRGSSDGAETEGRQPDETTASLGLKVRQKTEACHCRNQSRAGARHRSGYPIGVERARTVEIHLLPPRGAGKHQSTRLLRQLPCRSRKSGIGEALTSAKAATLVGSQHVFEFGQLFQATLLVAGLRHLARFGHQLACTFRTLSAAFACYLFLVRRS